MGRPGRPLGLSLAIITSVMLFSLLPIAQVVVYLLLQQRFENIEFIQGGGAVGGNLQSSLSNITLIFQIVSAAIFFVIAIFAWHGSPRSIRFVLMLAVLVLTAITIITTIISLTGTPKIDAGMDSAAPLANSLLRVRLIITALVALYVIWYVNRGPARAFYRGYYLPMPEEQKSEI